MRACSSIEDAPVEIDRLEHKPLSRSASYGLVLSAVGLWGLLRLVVFADSVLPLSYAIPLLICIWTRRPRMVWGMAAVFVVLAWIKSFHILPDSVVEQHMRYGVFAAKLVNVVVAAGVVHAVMALRESLERNNRALTEVNSRLLAANQRVNVQNEELRTTNEELARREELLETLLTANRSRSAETSVLESICRHGLELLGSDVFAVGLLQVNGKKLTASAFVSAGGQQLAETVWPTEKCLAATVIQENRSACLQDVETRPDLVFPRISNADQVRSVLCAPLRAGSRTIGAVEFYAHKSMEWTEAQFYRAEWVAAQASMFVEAMRLRRRLEESEERFRAIFEVAAVGLAQIAMDGRFLRFNRRYSEITGYPPSELATKTFRDITHPEDVELNVAQTRRLAAGEIDSYTMEKRYLQPDGKAVWVNLTGSVVRGKAGEPLYFVAAVEDINARKQVQQALAHSEERLRMALQAGSMGTWEFVPASSAFEWSDGYYRILGYSPGEVKPSMEAFRCRLHPEDVERQSRELDAAMAEKREYACEYRVVRPDGSIHWVEGRGRCVYDQSGAPVRMYGVAIPITLRKQIEQDRQALLDAERAARAEAERMNRLKDEFLATVSHELRSPLNAIVGWTRLLARGRAETSRATEIIERSASSLTQLVEDLLEMSRIVSGKIRLKRERVDLMRIVMDVLDGVAPAATAKGIHIDVSFDPQLRPLDCDPNRIQQVIWNLLTNAIKFTSQGGSIIIAVSQSPSHVDFMIRDTGQGIAPEFLPHMFDRFRQADGSVARQHGGLGLGLSIVKHLVELHGGTIRAHSDGENQGATFTVTLPCGMKYLERSTPARVRSDFATPTDSLTQDSDALEGLDILAVDDDQHNCDLLSRVLGEAGASVRVATSVDAALKLLGERKPDLLISDIGMPGQDGYSFIRQIRASGSQWADLTCVALTALARPEDCRRALEAGYDQHLAKPFDASTLVTALAELIERREPRSRTIQELFPSTDAPQPEEDPTTRGN